jgi:ATP-binding cassette subfamily C protein CydC
LILRRRRRVVTGALLMALTILAGTALLALSGWFITASALTGLLLAAGVSVHLDVYVPGSGIRAFALTRTLARYGERLYNHDTVLRLLADIRVRLFTTLGKSDPEALRQTHSAIWLSRLTRDVDALDSLFLRLLAPPLVALLATALVLGAMAFVLPVTAVCLAAGFLTLAVMSTALPDRLGRHSGRGLITVESELRESSIDYLNGLPELQTALYATLQAETLMVTQDRLQNHQHKQALSASLAESLQSGVLGGLVLFTLLSGLSAWQDEQLTGPVVMLWTLAAVALGEAYTSLPKAFAELGKTLLAARQLNGLEQLPQRGFSPPAQWQNSQLTIDLQAVQTAYPGHPALTPVSIKLRETQTLVITGNSGSGKSSLAGLLAAERLPVSGQIMVNAAPLSTADRPAWRQQVSWLTQDTVLFSDSVRNNLKIAKPQATDTDLWNALAMVCLQDRFAQTEDGLNTFIGQTGLALSGGEQRRLALARALLRPARVYLLDEPFRGVDAATARQILTTVEHALTDKTVIWLAHENSILPDPDHHVHLGL